MTIIYYRGDTWYSRDKYESERATRESLDKEVVRLQAELAEARAQRDYLDGVNSKLLDLANERQENLAAAESREQEMREALEAAVKSMEWMAERRVLADEPLVYVLVEIRQYAHSRALVAARALSGTDAPKETP